MVCGRSNFKLNLGCVCYILGKSVGRKCGTDVVVYRIRGENADVAVTAEHNRLLEQKLYRLPAGVLVQDVESGSCADKAGIIPGDVIQYAGKTRVESVDALNNLLYSLTAGDKLELTVYRYRTGKQFTVTVTLDEAN